MSLSIANTVPRAPVTGEPMRAEAGGAAMPGVTMPGGTMPGVTIPGMAIPGMGMPGLTGRTAAALGWLTDADLVRESAQLAALQDRQRRGGGLAGDSAGSSAGSSIDGGRAPPAAAAPAAGPGLPVPQTLLSLFRDA